MSALATYSNASVSSSLVAEFRYGPVFRVTQPRARSFDSFRARSNEGIRVIAIDVTSDNQTGISPNATGRSFQSIVDRALSVSKVATAGPILTWLVSTPVWDFFDDFRLKLIRKKVYNELTASEASALESLKIISRARRRLRAPFPKQELEAVEERMRAALKAAGIQE